MASSIKIWALLACLLVLVALASAQFGAQLQYPQQRPSGQGSYSAGQGGLSGQQGVNTGFGPQAQGSYGQQGVQANGGF